MDRVFKSKVGWWYHFAIILIIGGCVAAVLNTNVPAMIGMFIVAMIALHVLLNTWYRITADGDLIAHCSFFPEKKIAIADIEAVESSVMPVSSYALSLDRVIIWTKGNPWMLVSPQNKQDFVNQLRKINPAIEIRK